MEQTSVVRDRGQAMSRGFRLRCPACGEGQLMPKYLKIASRCPSCGEDFAGHKADDAPAYFTILIVGHVVIPGMLTAEIAWKWPVWLQIAVWIPTIVVLSLALLPRIKGAIVGLQWASNMHGFGGSEDQMGNAQLDIKGDIGSIRRQQGV